VGGGWPNEDAVFGDLGDGRTQLGQVVRRLAVKTLMNRHTGLERDPICHIEPVQRSSMELSETRGRTSLCRSRAAAFMTRCNLSVTTLLRPANSRLQ